MRKSTTAGDGRRRGGKDTRVVMVEFKMYYKMYEI
jgi:hypothetical protein